MVVDNLAAQSHLIRGFMTNPCLHVAWRECYECHTFQARGATSFEQHHIILYSLLLTIVHNGELLYLCSLHKHQAVGTLCFSVSLTRQEMDQSTHRKPASCAWVRVKRHDFTATSAMESGPAVCDARFKQKDSLAFIGTCIVYNLLLLLLKTGTSRHISSKQTAC